MSTTASGPSSWTATTAPATNPPSAPATASTTSTTSINNPLVKRPSNPAPKYAIWQILQKLLPSAGAVQIFVSLVGLLLTILGIKWAAQSYNVARMTEFKDFRDDCRSFQASGAPLSIACEEALGNKVEPLYLLAGYFSRLAKLDLYTGTTKDWPWRAKSEIVRLAKSWLKGTRRSGSIGFLLAVRSLEVPHAITRVLEYCNGLSVLIFLFFTVRTSQNYCLQNANQMKR
jgi:hypothetical protein